MNAATPEDEIGAERETGVPAPTLVLMRTRKEPGAAGSPSRADDASLSELWRIHGTVRARFAFKLTLGGKYHAGDIVREPCSAPGGTSGQSGCGCSRWPGTLPSTWGGPSRGTMTSSRTS